MIGAAGSLVFTKGAWHHPAAAESGTPQGAITAMGSDVMNAVACSAESTVHVSERSPAAGCCASRLGQMGPPHSHWARTIMIQFGVWHGAITMCDARRPGRRAKEGPR